MVKKNSLLSLIKSKIFRDESLLKEASLPLAFLESSLVLRCLPQPKQCSKGHVWLTGQRKRMIGRCPEELACTVSTFYFPVSPGQVLHKGSKLQKTQATLYNLPSRSSLSFLSVILNLIQYPSPFNSILNLTWYKRLENYLKSYDSSVKLAELWF